MPDTVRIDFADDGPGVPEERIETLFERKRNRGSSHGLGLYLASRLVGRYGGTIELTETGPDGSLFTVELPRVPATREPAPQRGVA